MNIAQKWRNFETSHLEQSVGLYCNRDSCCMSASNLNMDTRVSTDDVYSKG